MKTNHTNQNNPTITLARFLFIKAYLKAFAVLFFVLFSFMSFAQGFRTLGGNPDARLLTIHDGSGADDSKIHIGHQKATPTTAEYKLYVEKGVLSESVKVANPTSWSDFVFAQDYALRSLSEVEQFIKTNKHLPDVPSEKELIAQGYYDQHEINKVLLQKIEELTLYIIEQQKEIEKLKVLTQK